MPNHEQHGETADWPVDDLDPKVRKDIDDIFDHVWGPSVKELELTIYNPASEALENQVSVENPTTGRSVMVPLGLFELANANEITDDQLESHIESFERPAELLGWYRAVEILQHIRLLRWCESNDKDAVMLVQQSLTCTNDLKVWILGRDGCGVGHAVLGAIASLGVETKAIFGATCEPQKFFAISLRLRRNHVLDNWKNLNHFATALRAPLTKNLRDVFQHEYSVQINEQGELDEVLRINGVRLPRVGAQISIAFKQLQDAA